MFDSYSVCQSENTSIKAGGEAHSVTAWRTGHSHVLWMEGSLVKVPLRTIWKYLLKKHMVFDPVISLLETFTIDTLEKSHQDVLVRIHSISYKIENNLHAH